MRGMLSTSPTVPVETFGPPPTRSANPLRGEAPHYIAIYFRYTLPDYFRRA
jgi:hypothetical protein